MFTSTYKYNVDNKLVSVHSESAWYYSYNLLHTGNTIEIKGRLLSNVYKEVRIELNSANLVGKIVRSNSYSTFEYDGIGNLIVAKDFDASNVLLKEYEITYDQKNNPFYGQISSAYIDRFLFFFHESAKDGIDNLAFSTDMDVIFPYFRYNAIKIIETTNSSPYNVLLKRDFTYDAEDYPTKFEYTIVGYHDSTVTLSYK
jgi:hypothetical protein